MSGRSVFVAPPDLWKRSRTKREAIPDWMRSRHTRPSTIRNLADKSLRREKQSEKDRAAQKRNEDK